LVKGTPLLKVALAAVLLITETESALIEANKKNGVDEAEKAEKPDPVIDIVVSLVFKIAVTETNVLDV
jgi:hypothetical protein